MRTVPRTLTLPLPLPGLVMLLSSSVWIVLWILTVLLLSSLVSLPVPQHKRPASNVSQMTTVLVILRVTMLVIPAWSVLLTRIVLPIPC